MIKKTITLNGKEIRLEYPNASVRAMDKALGVSTLNLLMQAFHTSESRLTNLDVLATIIWAGTLTTHRTYTVEKITDMIPLEMSSLLDLVNTMVKTVSEIYGINDMEVEAEAELDEEQQGNVSGQPQSGAGKEANV